jgi:hypothetical protein
MLNKIKVLRGCTFLGTNLKENFIEVFRNSLLKEHLKIEFQKFIIGWMKLDDDGSIH